MSSSSIGAEPAVPVLEQHLLGALATLDQRGLQPPRHGGAHLAFVAGVGFGDPGEIGAHRTGVEHARDRARRGVFDRGFDNRHVRTGIAERARAVTAAVR